jgi:PAS domain S-box-containing protein
MKGSNRETKVGSLHTHTIGSPFPSNGSYLPKDLREIIDSPALHPSVAEFLGNESAFAEILDILEEPVLVIDTNHRVVFANQTFSRFSHVPRHQWLGNTGRSFETEEFARFQEEQDDYVFLTGLMSESEELGGIRPVDTHAGDFSDLQETRRLLTKKSLYISPTGVKYVVAIMRDITHQKQMEQELKRSETKFRTLFEAMTDAVVLFDLTNIADCNASALSMFLYDSKELLCKVPLQTIFPPAQSDGSDSLKPITAYVMDALKNGECRFRWNCQRNGGENFPTDIRFKVYTIEQKQYIQIFIRDITQQQATEDALRRSEQEYRRIIENQGEGVAVVNSEGYFMFANPVAHEIFGVEIGSLIRKRLREFISIPSALALRKQITEMPPTEKTTQEAEFTRGDKTRGIIMMTSTQQFDENHQLNGALIIFRDITKQKLAEQALRESEERYRSMIEQSPDGIYMLDVETKRVVLANHAFARMLGYTGVEILDTSIYGIIDASRDNVDDKIEQVVKSKETVVREWPYKRKDGSLIQVRASTGLIIYGNRTTLNTIIQDITEQKRHETELRESEERFRLISENVADFILLFNPDGVCLYASSSFTSMGYSPDILQKKNIFEFVHSEDRPQLQKQIETIQENLTHCSSEFRFLKSDHCWSDMETTASLLFNDEGYRIVMVMRDISERKKNERQRNELLSQLQNKNAEIEKTLRQLTRMQEGLVQSEKMASLGQLTAGIAHEINNPLAFVSSNLNRFHEYFNDVRTLLNGWMEYGSHLQTNPALQQAITELQEQAQRVDLAFIDHDFEELMKHTREGTSRIKRIVEQLRGFSHANTSDFILANINQAIDETLTLVWNELKYKATVIKEYGELPQAKCNIGELQQVFVNLLVNAAHAIPEMGKIRIQTSATASDVIVKISDTGSGIPKEHLTKIFDPFFTTKPVGKGTGLGLWIVSTIIQNHHGEIFVESEAGKGSCFTIRIPLQQEQKE